MFSWFKKSSEKPELSERMLKLERIIGVRIDDPSLFEKALRHRSSLNEEGYEAYESYERLEFLGDAVLDLIASEILFELYPKKDEGFLTKLRAKLVRGDTLSLFSFELGFKELMEVGDRASQSVASKSVMADVFESVVAAIYITKGYRAAFQFVQKVIQRHIDFEELESKVDNFKSALLEYAQANKLPVPKYKLLSETGPGHNKSFEVVAVIGNEEKGTGKGKSKKKAEQIAARETLKLYGLQ